MEHGAKDWTMIASHLPGRIGKQCRERWHHHLNPDVVKKKWCFDEDVLITHLFLRYSSRWSEIARYVPGRTDNQIKNRYNSNLKKRFHEEPFATIVKEYNEMKESTCNESENDEQSETFVRTVKMLIEKLKSRDVTIQQGHSAQTPHIRIGVSKTP